jgi:hypothetical protein
MVKQGGFLPAMWKNDRESPLATWLVKFTRFCSSCTIHFFFALSPLFGFALHHSKKINKRNGKNGELDRDVVTFCYHKNE